MSDLIKALQNPAIYPHPISGFEVIQTHLSWVILTGEYAYKIKKPLNLGFQDFTTLEKRKHYCQLEISLNKILAPEIYIESLPITGTEQNPSIHGQGTIIEYAVKMHQFSQSQILSNLVKENKLNKTLVNDISEKIADFHLLAKTANQNDFGEPKTVFAPMKDNFLTLKSQASCMPFLPLIEEIEAWTNQQYTALKPVLISRKLNGFIRACHGDFHLGNMVIFHHKLAIFDCIEFNEYFRWIDVMSDIGFFAMDLEHYQQKSLSYLFINKYLEYTNDYEGLKILKFYQCYRAMVRAKITSLQIEQLKQDSPLMPKLQQDLSNLLTLGQNLTKTPPLSLTITYGLSGTGKTLCTENLMMQHAAIRLRSDVIRKHQHKLNPFIPTPSDKKSLLYSTPATKALYHSLQTQAKELLQAGWPVIIDATCLKKWQRQLFFDCAKECHVPFKILAFTAPFDTLEKRIQSRHMHQDASDADLQVLKMQLEEIEALTNEEKLISHTITSTM